MCALGAITRSTVYPQSTTLDYYIMSANCSGEEDTFFECPYTLMQPGHMCSSDAGVICQGMVITHRVLQNIKGASLASHNKA